MSTKKRPGGELANRPLHFIWIADCSSSMGYDGKIQTLNFAIKNAIPEMQKVADENPHAKVLIRAIKFSTGAQWYIAKETPVSDFKWTDLSTDGITDMGRAFSMVADQLNIPPMTDRALPPVLVLISDGQPTDDFQSGLDNLMSKPWGKKAVRIAIGIGKDANYSVLQKFIGHNELKPLEANNPEALVKQIKWVTTEVLKAASSPPSQIKDNSSPKVNVPIPAPPTTELASANDVW